MESDGDASGSTLLIGEGKFECIFLRMKGEFVEERLYESDVPNEEVYELHFADLRTDVDQVFSLDPTRIFFERCGELTDSHVFLLSHVVYSLFLEKLRSQLL